MWWPIGLLFKGIQLNISMKIWEIFCEKVRLWSKVSFLKLDGPSVCHLQEFTASRCQCWNTVLTSFLPWIAESCNVSVGDCCTLGSFEIVGFVPVVQTTESAHLSLQIRINGNKDRLTPVPSHLQQIKLIVLLMRIQRSGWLWPILDYGNLFQKKNYVHE